MPRATAGRPERLNSWKEIASWFDRDVRTVQLWEKHENLPVHRHTHSSRSTVYALTAELDLWFAARRRSSKLAAPPEPPVAASSGRLTQLFPHQARRFTVAAVLLLLLTTAATVAWRSRHRFTSHAPVAAARPTLAVLPLQDLAPGSGSGLWVDGLTDDLITDLGRYSSFDVISRRSSSQFRGANQPMAAVAAQLHANLVLEGTIATQGGQTRITVQLVDALHDRQIWSARYIRATKDILSLQDDIARQITAELTEKVTGVRPVIGLASRAVDPRIRLEYLSASYLLAQRDGPSLLLAIEHFQRAIALGPQYAPAYAGLADCYNLLSVWGRLPSAQAFPQARAAAETALQLDPDSAEATTALAFETSHYEWDFPKAEAYFRKAIALNPNYVPAHHWYGQYLADTRRFDQAFVELRRAATLDPLSDIVACDLADAYIFAHRYQDAIVILQRILKRDPGFTPAHDYLAATYIRTGELDLADQEAHTFQRLTGNDGKIRAVQMERSSRQGDRAAQRRELLRSIHDPNLTPFHLAAVYFAMGDKENGYAALDQAVELHEWWLITLPVEDVFDSVREQPRFRAIEARVGLPTDEQVASR
jgi:TolB-like protein/Flp pilus assembly protein TadD